MNRLLKLISVLLIVGQGIITMLILVNKSTIPTHWGITGDVDSTGSRYVSLLLVVISIACYLSFCFLDKHPEWHNYPKKFVDRAQANMYLSRFAWMTLTGSLLLFSYLNIMMYLGGNLNLWIVAAIFLLTIAGVVKCITKLNKIN